MISEIFCLSIKGEVIFHKKYRFDLLDNALEIFKKRLHDGNPNSLTPHWKQDGIYYYHLKRNNVFLVAVSKTFKLLFITEILTRLYQLTKDFCGTFNEDSLKSNIILVYELLDEFVDHGHVQLCSTDKLKPYIQSDPVTVRAAKTSHQMTSGLFGVEYRAPAAPSSADKPVIRSQADQENRRDEIFLDVVERISVMMECNNELTRFDLNGRVNMKCFLSVGGSPRIHIALNDDLQLGNEKAFHCGLTLDEYALHESIDREQFVEKKELVTVPPQGEYTAMTYSVSLLAETPPIRFILTTKENSSLENEVTIKIRCNIPDNAEAINISARITLPKIVQNVSILTKGSQQGLQYVSKDGYLQWTVKRLQGGHDTMAKFKTSLVKPRTSKTDITPVLLDFEISGHVTSGLAIKYLRVSDPSGCAIKPYRWIRYITVPDSYIVNVNWV